MKVKVKTDMNYIEFLGMIQQVSRSSESYQNKVMKKVYKNFDICQLKNKLDKQIEYFNRLLSIEK
ncbi:MAG: hypothetical protein JSV62_12960 [Promethearchaeota archaeon]|nr:MAG: hypothetical protein JSV62_12960 [Candidatus Lokiarchaeota archaeon]